MTIYLYSTILNYKKISFIRVESENIGHDSRISHAIRKPAPWQIQTHTHTYIRGMWTVSHENRRENICFHFPQSYNVIHIFPFLFNKQWTTLMDKNWIQNTKVEIKKQEKCQQTWKCWVLHIKRGANFW